MSTDERIQQADRIQQLVVKVVEEERVEDTIARTSEMQFGITGRRVELNPALTLPYGGRRVGRQVLNFMIQSNFAETETRAMAHMLSSLGHVQVTPDCFIVDEAAAVKGSVYSSLFPHQSEMLERLAAATRFNALYGGMGAEHFFCRCQRTPLPEPAFPHPIERPDYSRYEATPGPTGHPTKHRKNRKLRKASRRRNR